MNLERVSAALGPAPVSRVADAGSVEIRDLAYDTRAVVPGSLFFCVPGSRFDGHDLAADAVAAGAVALVVERPLEVSVPQLLVPSVRRAMPAAATLFFGNPSAELAVTAVTGTNGKTTSAFLLRSILDAAGRRPGVLTNIERRVGGWVRPTGLNTPEAIDLQRLFREMLEAGDRSCVMEATSIAAAQGRLDGTRFAVLLFTNLTQDHLDFHGTMESYFAAKRALFEQAERSVVNVEDEWGRRLAQELRERRDVHARRRSRRYRAPPPRTLQSRECAGRDRRRAGAGRPGGGDPRRHRARSRRSGPIRVGGRRAAVRGHRRLRAHAGLARERAAAPRAAWATAGSWSCSVRAATGIARNGR